MLPYLSSFGQLNNQQSYISSQMGGDNPPDTPWITYFSMAKKLKIEGLKQAYPTLLLAQEGVEEKGSENYIQIGSVFPSFLNCTHEEEEEDEKEDALRKRNLSFISSLQKEEARNKKDNNETKKKQHQYHQRQCESQSQRVVFLEKNIENLRLCLKAKDLLITNQTQQIQQLQLEIANVRIKFKKQCDSLSQQQQQSDDHQELEHNHQERKSPCSLVVSSSSPSLTLSVLPTQDSDTEIYLAWLRKMITKQERFISTHQIPSFLPLNRCENNPSTMTKRANGTDLMKSIEYSEALIQECIQTLLEQKALQEQDLQRLQEENKSLQDKFREITEKEKEELQKEITSTQDKWISRLGESINCLQGKVRNFSLHHHPEEEEMQPQNYALHQVIAQEEEKEEGKEGEMELETTTIPSTTTTMPIITQFLKLEQLVKDMDKSVDLLLDRFNKQIEASNSYQNQLQGKLKHVEYLEKVNSQLDTRIVSLQYKISCYTLELEHVFQEQLQILKQNGMEKQLSSFNTHIDEIQHEETQNLFLGFKDTPTIYSHFTSLEDSVLSLQRNIRRVKHQQHNQLKLFYETLLSEKAKLFEDYNSAERYAGILMIDVRRIIVFLIIEFCHIALISNDHTAHFPESLKDLFHQIWHYNSPIVCDVLKDLDLDTIVRDVRRRQGIKSVLFYYYNDNYTAPIQKKPPARPHGIEETTRLVNANRGLLVESVS